MTAKGDRIRLLCMPDDPNPIPAGSEGEVTFVNEVRSMQFTQIGVKWDDGRTLSLAVPPDSFTVIGKAKEG
jgi:hypothetical protein